MTDRPRTLPPKVLNQKIAQAVITINWRLKWLLTGLKPETRDQVRGARHNFGAALLASNELFKLLTMKMEMDDLPQFPKD